MYEIEHALRKIRQVREGAYLVIAPNEEDTEKMDYIVHLPRIVTSNVFPNLKKFIAYANSCAEGV